MTQAQAIRAEKFNKVIAMLRVNDFKVYPSSLIINWGGCQFTVTKNFKVFYSLQDLSKATFAEVINFMNALTKAVYVAKDAETFAEDDIKAGANVLVVMPDKTKVAGKVDEVWDTPQGSLYKVATESGIIEATNDNIILK